MNSDLKLQKELLSPPGDTIQETIDAIGMSQAELAERIGRPKEKLNDIIKFAAINLKLKPGEKGREIAIGYGHVADADRLNAINSLNKNDFNFSRYNNIFELIRGRCAGVQVIDNRYIIIRGINSINSKENSALVLVDGTPYNMDALKSIEPSHVKSIDFIKDAGAAIYGTRGANGVILIETNRGDKK